MSEVITVDHIDAPPEKVWDVVMDPHRLEWVTIHRKLNSASDGEMDQTLCTARRQLPRPLGARGL